jgi:hypothetical protein
VTLTFVNRVEQLVDGSPDPQWNHTTWTEELLTLVMAEETGIAVSVSTLCLCAQFQSYQLLHLIVNNYIIHTSQITQKAIAAKKGKVQCHFLPPYCPQHESH